MTLTEILNSNLNKTEKAKKLFDLGYTRTQVAEYVTNGNYGLHTIFGKNGLRNKRQILSTYLSNMP